MREPLPSHFPRLVMFDLDGTLVDSVPDIAVALNAALGDLGLSTADVENIRRWVGTGARDLAQRAAANAGRADDTLVDELYRRYLERYAERVCVDTVIYPGVEDGLAQLRAQDCRLACVTNKPAGLSNALLRVLGMDHWFALVIGGDSLRQRKPDPAPLRHAMQELRVPPERALMVGDSATDVAAAHAAGVACACVSYGYHRGEDPRALGADLLVDSLADLPALLRQPYQRRAGKPS